MRNAVSLLPADPIVNDHYGDVLWKTGNKIQARYYWNYVLNLKNTEKDLKDKIELKLQKAFNHGLKILRKNKLIFIYK